MDPIKDLRARLREYNITGLRRISAGCGVPWHTIYKIRVGQTTNPQFRTVEKLAYYFGIALSDPRGRRKEDKESEEDQS